jgi:hypothetical protein
MALRRNVALGFALALGMAFGYAVRPAAQEIPPPNAQAPTFFTVVPGSQGNVSLSIGNSTRALESSELTVYLTREFLYLKMLSGPNKATIGSYAIRVPER